jgi:hypothetical protein
MIMSDLPSSLDPAIKSALTEKPTDHEPGGYSGNPFFGARADFCARVAGRVERHPSFLENTMVESARKGRGERTNKIVMQYEGETDSDVQKFFDTLAENYDVLSGKGVGLKRDETNEGHCHIYPVDVNGEWLGKSLLDLLGQPPGVVIDLTDEDNEILSKFLEKRLCDTEFSDVMDAVERDEPALSIFLSHAPSAVKEASESVRFNSDEAIELAKLLHPSVAIEWNCLEEEEKETLRSAIRGIQGFPSEEEAPTCTFLRMARGIVVTAQYAYGDWFPMIELVDPKAYAIVDQRLPESETKSKKSERLYKRRYFAMKQCLAPVEEEEAEDKGLKEAAEFTGENIKYTRPDREPLGAGSSYLRPESRPHTAPSLGL